MGKIKVTISLDKKVKGDMKKILILKGISLSFWIEQQMRDYINNYKGGNENV